MRNVEWADITKPEMCTADGWGVAYVSCTMVDCLAHSAYAGVNEADALKTAQQYGWTFNDESPKCRFHSGHGYISTKGL